MPLNAKGSEIMASMTKTYGTQKGKKVFYASRNSGKIKGVDKPRMNKKKSSAPKTAMN